MIRYITYFIISVLFAGPTNHYKELKYQGSVNAVIGDISFNKKFGYEPDKNTTELIRIKTHLEYVISQLRKENTNHLSPKQVENRKHLLSLLVDYVNAEQFPKNNHFKNRQPVFIDEDGNFCAVGYLVAQTGGEDVARKINEHHKFDFIDDIESGFLDEWLAENGLTKKEAAMIQPAYGPVKETINNNHIETEYAVASSLLAGIQTGMLSYSLVTENSATEMQTISALNAALGATSLTLGLLNLDNSRIERHESMMWPREITYTNNARKNFSTANVAFGGASVIFNSIQFFRARKKEKSNLNVQATHLYNPTNGSQSPALSVRLKF